MPAMFAAMPAPGRRHRQRPGVCPMTTLPLDSFKCCKTLKVGNRSYVYYSLKAAEKNGLAGIAALPFSLKVLLENLLRHEDGRSVTRDDIAAVAKWVKNRGKRSEEHT